MIRVITALFDIGREKDGDGRSIDQYLEWFSKTLELNSYMEIYTEEKFVDFIEKRRDPNLTNIIVQNLEDIPAYVYRKKISEIIKDPSYLSKIKDNDRIECNLDLYNVIQYSKFGWLKESIERGRPDDYYFWMDAGCSRFFGDFDTSKDWPVIERLSVDQFMIQGNYNTSLIYPDMEASSYIWRAIVYWGAHFSEVRVMWFLRFR
jgi:hypothetical protein